MGRKGAMAGRGRVRVVRARKPRAVWDEWMGADASCLVRMVEG